MEDLNKKEFNFTVLFIVVFAIASIIVLLLIWWPKGNTKSEKITKYTAITDGENKCLSIYMSELKYILNSDHCDELFKKVDPDFLQSNNLNKDNFEEYMNDMKLITKNPVFKDTNISKQLDGTYVYRIGYLTYGGLKKYVNVIETKPYEYTVSFEQDKLPVTNSNTSSITVDGVFYEVKISEIRENGITYKLTATNKGDKTVEYNFNNIDNVIITLDDKTKIKMGAAVISSEDDILTPNGTFNREFFFSIGSQYIEKINTLTLNSVIVDGKSNVVNINLKQ